MIKAIIKRIIPATWLRGLFAVRSIHQSSIDSIKIALSKVKRFISPIPIPRLENDNIYLHLGCGEINHPRFINIDGRPSPHIHHVRSLNDLSIFRDKTVDLIYASHCLEHFSHAQVSNVLTEWYRVLKPGGILRLSVPDFDKLVEIYHDCDNDVSVIMNALMGGQDYKYNFHAVVFNRSSLTNLLEKVGFKDIKEWQPYSCDLTSFNDHSTCEFTRNGKKYLISLNLQGTK